jgi:hypothetical protein
VSAASPVTVLAAGAGAGAAEVDGVPDLGEADALGAELGGEEDGAEGAEDEEDDPELGAAPELGADPAPGCAPPCTFDWVIVKLLSVPLAASGVLLCGFRPSSRTTPETVAVPVTIARRMEQPL